jgi:putative ABC transport system permease protein
VVFVDDDVFKIFDFKFIYGNPENAFDEITSIVLTESSAIKIFGTDWKEKEILGESVTIARDGQQAQFKVTGVMEDMPVTQHFHFEYLAPLRFLAMLFGEETMNYVGGNYNWMTYIKVSDGTDIASLQKKTNEEFWDKYMGEFRPGVYARDYYDFEFQPLLEIHLNSNLEGEIESNGSFQQVLIFSIIGILLLLVAIINYMNLSTSHFSRRMKEIGVRKVVGAMKGSLIRQFLTESFLITLLSFPFAIGLVYWALPYLNDFMDVELSLNLITDYQLLFSLISLLILVSIAAGSYPAVFLARTNLVTALKGEQAINAKKWNFRSFLVTFQYAVTIGLIFSILTIDAQLRFIRNTNPGYQKDQLVEVSLSRSISNLNTFKQEILNHPAIEKASYASRIPTGRLADSWGAGMYKGDSVSPVNFRLPFILIDEDFINTFEIPLIAGENFSRSQDMGADSIGYYIINRKAAEAFGYSDPKDAVGERLIYGQFDGQTYRVGRIQGVVEDFHFESMHSEIKPMVMLKANWGYRRIMVKLKAGEIESGLAHIEKTWPTFDSENTLNYRFLDDIFNEQYQAEERLSTMIKTFTVLAVLIGCLGLVGMVGFVIETRIKEIGVRKVLGASTQNIILMITQRFAILMVIAFAVIMPIVFYLMSNWLDNFVYQTSINVFLIIMPILAAALLTLLSIGYQSIRAANVNPVNYLKDE